MNKRVVVEVDLEFKIWKTLDGGFDESRARHVRLLEQLDKKFAREKLRRINYDAKTVKGDDRVYVKLQYAYRSDRKTKKNTEKMRLFVDTTGFLIGNQSIGEICKRHDARMKKTEADLLKKYREVTPYITETEIEYGMITMSTEFGCR